MGLESGGCRAVEAIRSPSFRREYLDVPPAAAFVRLFPPNQRAACLSDGVTVKQRTTTVDRSIERDMGSSPFFSRTWRLRDWTDGPRDRKTIGNRVRGATKNPSMRWFASRATLTDSRQPITSGRNSTYTKPKVSLSQALGD